MNYGGDAADQIVRYSMEGMEHTLRISGSIAKNLAVLIVAVMKDQKKTRGKTNLLRMLKEQRAMKFFTIPHDRLREFAGEAKSRGLLYVVIRDKKNPKSAEIMVFADDAAKVNRVLDKMNLDFVKSEAGEAVVEQAPVREAERVIDAEFTEKTEGKEELPVKTEKVVLPEGTIEFELDEEEHLFDVGEVTPTGENFTQAEKAGNLSGPSSHNSASFSGQETSRKWEKPSVRQELKKIETEQRQRRQTQKSRRKPRNQQRKKKKVKGRKGDMDLTNMIPGGAGEEQAPEQRLSKEEYAAMKKQQREEVWAEVDVQAQAVFQNGESLKGFLDFMAQCNTQKTPNLLLIYGQNPQATVVKSYDYWKKEHRSPKVGVHGYTYMVSTEYEKDGERRTGYTISKGFDISQMSGKSLEERPQRSMEELIHAVLKDQPVQMQIADNLPEGIQAQYIPKQRTVYVQNGMEENTTFHAVNRELACAALDQHDGNYVRKKVNAQAYCAAYVIGKRYGVEVSGFQFGKIAEMQANGQKDPQELRGFLNDVRQAAYTIRNHMERNFGEQEQTFSKDDFSFEEPPKQTPKKEKKEKQPER